MATTTKKQPVSSAKRAVPIVGIVFGVIAAVLIAAVLFSPSDPIGSEFGEPEVEGALAPMPPSTVEDLSVTGQPLVTVVGEDFDGNEVRIENDGRAKAIVFLAHWCPHCQAEVPRVQQWLDSGGGVEGVEIISVATSMNSGRGNFPASDWLEREGWTAPIIRDDDASLVYASYGAGGFPFWVFVNSDGTIARRTSGETSIADLEAIMLSLT